MRVEPAPSVRRWRRRASSKEKFLVVSPRWLRAATEPAVVKAVAALRSGMQKQRSGSLLLCETAIEGADDVQALGWLSVVLRRVAATVNGRR